MSWRQILEQNLNEITSCKLVREALDQFQLQFGDHQFVKKIRQWISTSSRQYDSKKFDESLDFCREISGIQNRLIQEIQQLTHHQPINDNSSLILPLTFNKSTMNNLWQLQNDQFKLQQYLQQIKIIDQKYETAIVLGDIGQSHKFKLYNRLREPETEFNTREKLDILKQVGDIVSKSIGLRVPLSNISPQNIYLDGRNQVRLGFNNLGVYQLNQGPYFHDQLIKTKTDYDHFRFFVFPTDKTIIYQYFILITEVLFNEMFQNLYVIDQQLKVNNKIEWNAQYLELKNLLDILNNYQQQHQEDLIQRIYQVAEKTIKSTNQLVLSNQPTNVKMIIFDIPSKIPSQVIINYKDKIKANKNCFQQIITWQIESKKLAINLLEQPATNLGDQNNYTHQDLIQIFRTLNAQNNRYLKGQQIVFPYFNPSHIMIQSQGQSFEIVYGVGFVNQKGSNNFKGDSLVLETMTSDDGLWSMALPDVINHNILCKQFFLMIVYFLSKEKYDMLFIQGTIVLNSGDPRDKINQFIDQLERLGDYDEQFFFNLLHEFSQPDPVNIIKEKNEPGRQLCQIHENQRIKYVYKEKYNCCKLCLQDIENSIYH